METDFDAKMRSLEYFHGLRLVPETWTAVRLDGRSFTRFTERMGFKKPFDEKLRDFMVQTAKDLMEEVNAVYAYTESDEISILLPPNWDLFDREIEKLISISAAIATGSFVLQTGQKAQFDARAIPLATKELVTDYFRWRQEDANRNCINTTCYWYLRQNENMNVNEATELLSGKGFSWKNEYLFQKGLNYNDVPLWQKRGVGISWKMVEKPGWNPKKQEATVCQRREAVNNYELPCKDDYAKYLEVILANADR